MVNNFSALHGFGQCKEAGYAWLHQQKGGFLPLGVSLPAILMSVGQNSAAAPMERCWEVLFLALASVPGCAVPNLPAPVVNAGLQSTATSLHHGGSTGDAAVTHALTMQSSVNHSETRDFPDLTFP